MNSEKSKVEFNDLISNINKKPQKPIKKPCASKDIHEQVDAVYAVLNNEEREKFEKELRSYVSRKGFDKVYNNIFNEKDQEYEEDMLSENIKSNFDLKIEELKGYPEYKKYLLDKIKTYVFPVKKILNKLNTSVVMISISVLIISINKIMQINPALGEFFFGFILGYIGYALVSWGLFLKKRNENKLYVAKMYPLIDVLYAAGVSIDKLKEDDMYENVDIKNDAFLINKIIKERKS